MISNKVIFNNIPVFNNFSLIDDGVSLNPFIHFNALWTPESSTQPEYNPLHLSAGFGFSLMTNALACEIYYNAYIKKNSHDVGREFSIKFGLD